MQSSPQTLQTPASYEGSRGTLSFDGNRLNFFYVSGILNKQRLVPVSIPVQLIAEVTVEGVINRKLVVRTNQTDAIPRYEFEVADPERWAKWLSAAEHPPAPKEPVIVREITEKVTVLVKCSHCGYHAEQGTINCPNCGGLL